MKQYMQDSVKEKKKDKAWCACLLCGNKATYKVIQKSYQAPDLFSIYHCQNCNTAFSMPRVSADAIYELIYKNIDKVRSYDRYYNYQHGVLKSMSPLKYLANAEPSYWGPINAILNILKLDHTAKILEVGSGLGYFTYALRKEGYNAYGLDISKESTHIAKINYGNYYLCEDLFKYAETHSESYDVLIMTEVIEHINEPKSFIQASKCMIKKGGSIIITTPNKSFYSKNVAWFSDAPPVHCWWFSEDSMKYIAKLYDMKIHFIDFKDFYRNYLQIFKVKNIDSDGCFVFDKEGNVIKTDIIQNDKYFFIPQYVRRNKIFKVIKNVIIKSILPQRYKFGGTQTYVMCVILTKY